MRWTKVIALATAGTLSLAACGGSSTEKKSEAAGGSGSSSGANNNDYTKVPASAGFEPDAKGPAADLPGSKKGGTLTFNVKSST